jgi:queuine tRNA-ribosyltransferase
MAAVLTTFHNLAFMARLMEDVRAAIAAGTFAAFRRRFLADYLGEDGNG